MSAMAAAAQVRTLVKLLASAAIVAFLWVLMVHFHITTYAYLASAFAGSGVIVLWTRPSSRLLAGAVLIAVIFAAGYAIGERAPVLGAWYAFLGLGLLATQGIASVWASAARRQGGLDTLLTALLFPIFLIVAGLSLGLTTELYPKTFDVYLYAFDDRLGFQPSFLAGRVLARFALLRHACYIGYETLPLAMAIAFAAERHEKNRRTYSILTAFVVAALGGFVLYNVCPAAGPVHAFGKLFPNLPPHMTSLAIQLVTIGPAPRNAMPSVHIAMALLILWRSRPWPRVSHLLAAALLILTILATLGFGEHYLIDLVVAAPFALSCEALAASALPWRTPERHLSLAAGAGSVAAWLTYLRQPPLLPTRGAALSWILVAATVAVSLLLERRLNRAANPPEIRLGYDAFSEDYAWRESRG
jgi:PAP2 superfamily